MGQNQSVDYAIVFEGQAVGAVPLSRTETLADARREIDGDDLPVPEDYRFVLPSGAPVARSQEGKRTVEASAGEGDRIVLKAGPLEGLRECLGPLHHLDEALIAEQARRFVEGTRKWALEQFDEWVIAGPGDPHRVFVLAGNAGVGKTGLMCKLSRDRRDVVVARHFCRHDDARRSNPRSMLLSIAYQLAVSFPEYSQRLELHIRRHKLSRAKLMGSEYDCVTIFTELFENLLRDLDVGTGASRHVILIDAIDECGRSCSSRYGILECIRNHFKSFPPWLGVFITTRPEVPIKEKLKCFDPIEIQPSSADNLADLAIFFRALLNEKGVKNRLRVKNVERAVETLVAKSQGLFIYAVMTADAMRQSKEDITEEILLGFPDGLDGFYQEQMERAFPNTNNCLAWDIVKLVIAAVEPLHVELVERLTGCTEEQCRDAVHEISRFFPVQDEQILVYHKSLEDWLVSKERSQSRYHIRVDDTEERLAKGCLEVLGKAGIFTRKKTGAKPVHLNEAVVTYPLRHGIKHLLSCGMRREARCLILEVGWLVARTGYRDCLGIVQDCRLFREDDRMVELVGRAISLAQRILLRNPWQFAPQMVGRLTGPADPRGGETVETRMELLDLLERLKFYDYGGQSWWCPITACWDPANSPCLQVMAGHRSSVRSVRWSHDGEFLASGSSHGTVRIWSAETGECFLVIRAEKDIGKRDIGKVNDLAWSHDDTRLACAFSGRGKIRVFDVATGDYIELSAGHASSGYRTVAWSPSDEYLAVGSVEKVLILRAADGMCLHEIHGVKSADVVSSIKWSHEGSSVAVAAGHGVRVFGKLQSGALELTYFLQEHVKNVNNISWSYDDKMLLSTSDDGFLIIWSSDTGKRLRIISKMGPIRSADWSHDGKTIVAGYVKNTVRVWDVASGRCTHVLRGHTGAVLSVECSLSAKIASSGSDHTVRLWDVSSSDRSLRGWEGHSVFICCECWLPDGRYVATAGVDGNVRIWEVSTGKTTKILRGHSGRINCIAASHDGSLIASGANDRRVRVWNVPDSEGNRDEWCLHVLSGHTDAVRSVAWTADSSFLASGAHDVRTWNVKTGACMNVFVDGESDLKVYSLAWSPDNEYLVSAVAGEVKCWHVGKGECKNIITEQAGVRFVAYSDNGKNLMYTTLKDRRACILDSSSGECEQELVGRSETYAELSRLQFASALKEFYFSGLWCEGQKVDMNRFGVFGQYACGISGNVVRFFTLFGGNKSTSDGNKIAFLQSDPLVYREGGPRQQFNALPRLDFTREKELMAQCLSDASRDIDLAFHAATTEALQDAVVNRVDCLHFSGHGAPTYLLLEDGRGGAHFLDDGMLSELYPNQEITGAVRAPHKLAFVSACFSEYLASIFVNAGVDHVVCVEHEAELADEAAHVFMKSFYMALAVGHTVKVSFDMGRQAVAAGPFVLNAAEEKKKFVLLPKGGDHDKAVFFARPLEERRRCSMPQLLLPRPTELRSEWQICIYLLLNNVLERKFVTIVGGDQDRRSAIGAAVCHYINDRKGSTEIEIDAVLCVDSKNVEEGSAMPLLHQQLSSAGLLDDMDKESTEPQNLTVRGFVTSLKGLKLLIFINICSSEANASLRSFLERLLSFPGCFKILLTSKAPIGDPREHVYNLEEV